MGYAMKYAIDCPIMMTWSDFESLLVCSRRARRMIENSGANAQINTPQKISAYGQAYGRGLIRRRSGWMVECQDEPSIRKWQRRVECATPGVAGRSHGHRGLSRRTAN